MNKKIMMPVMILLGIGLVFAIGYYALFSASFTVLPSITLSGECEDTFGEVYDGDILEGSECTLTNDAPTERHLLISNDAIDGIEVSYLGTLELSNKDSEWTPINTPITVGYTILGDSLQV